MGKVIGSGVRSKRQQNGRLLDFRLLWQDFRPSLRICNVFPHRFGGKHMSYHGDCYIDIVYSFSTYCICIAALEAMFFLEKAKSSISEVMHAGLAILVFRGSTQATDGTLPVGHSFAGPSCSQSHSLPKLNSAPILSQRFILTLFSHLLLEAQRVTRGSRSERK